jgi:hypothetical protein
MNERHALTFVVPTIGGKAIWHSHHPRPDAMVCLRPVQSDTLVCAGISSRHDMPCGFGVEGYVIVAITALLHRGVAYEDLRLCVTLLLR